MLLRRLSLFWFLLGGRQSSAPRCCRGYVDGSMGSMCIKSRDGRAIVGLFSSLLLEDFLQLLEDFILLICHCLQILLHSRLHLGDFLLRLGNFSLRLAERALCVELVRSRVASIRTTKSTCAESTTATRVNVPRNRLMV